MLFSSLFHEKQSAVDTKKLHETKKRIVKLDTLISLLYEDKVISGFPKKCVSLCSKSISMKRCHCRMKYRKNISVISDLRLLTIIEK